MVKKKQQEYIKGEKRRGKSLKMRNASVTERRKAIGKHLSFGAAEAYKLLRTNLMFSVADEGTCKIIGVTSALRGEGKSTTAANLAYTMAQSGKKTLLLEADMRIPVQASVLQMEESPGLSHVLTGMNTLTEAIRQSTSIRKMSVLPAGEVPPNPSELLSSKTMGIVMKSLEKVFDYIIVDLPPINAVSDGLAVSKLLTGMVVVVRQNYCDRQALAEAMRRLELLDVKLLGFILNDAEPAKKRYKKYGYGHGYYHGHRGKAKETTAAMDNESVFVPVSKAGAALGEKRDV